jgi:hypothetical protein
MTRSRLILAALLVAGGAIRFATLDVQGYHHDEAVTAVRILPVSFGEMLDLVIESERSAHLYYVLAWLWTQPFGTGEVGLRSFSALVGTLTIAAAYLAGRELAGKRAGLIAAALVAASPILIWYSLEARSYGLLVLFSTLALAFCARSLRDPGPRPLVLWALSSALAIASHYFAVFVLAAQAAWLLYRHADRTRAVVASSGVAAAGLALLPIAIAQQAGRGADIFTERGLLFRVAEMAKTFMTGERPRPLAGNTIADVIQVGATSGAVALLALGALAALAWSGGEARRGARLTLAVGSVGVGVPFLLALVGLDFVNPRNMLAAVVPLLAASAIGFSLRPGGDSGAIRRHLGIAGVIVVIGVFAVVGAAHVASSQFQRDDWRGAAEAIGETSEPRVIVANRNGDDPLLYYLDGAERFDREEWGEQAARVREVVTVSQNHDVKTPRGFELVERQGLAPRFVLHRFRSQRARLLAPQDVNRDQVLPERSLALADGNPTPALSRPRPQRDGPGR